MSESSKSDPNVALQKVTLENPDVLSDAIEKAQENSRTKKAEERRKNLAKLINLAKSEDLQSLSGVYLEDSPEDDDIAGLWGVKNQPEEDFRNLLPDGNAAKAGKDALSNAFKNGNLAGFVLDSADTVTDCRYCRLFTKLDLSEWLELKNIDVYHIVVEEPGEAKRYCPLGRTTIWVDAGAQIRHVRSKTAKTFIRGQIAQRLRIEDIESNVEGFVNTIFDTDSEQAYSSSDGPC